jgi:pantoate--beta-alanine ligase
MKTGVTQIITAINEMKEYSHRARREDRTIGFVPTMGYLHEGHLSLVRAAREECDVVVVSIFVNPTQFAPGEDFDKYPRDMQRDRRLAEKEGVDVVFAPSAGEMYPDGHVTYVEVTGPLAEGMCGRSRPGHFRGVATIVAKLFDVVQPHVSYFGQKDAQQIAVIKRMVKDLNMDVEIREMPIVREEDGLAMSSRNAYLSKEERQQALGLFRSLERAKEMVADGELSTDRIKREIRKMLEAGQDVRVDYIEIVDAQTLAPLGAVKDNTLIAVAAFAGGTRLIDNVVIRL